MKKEFYYLEYNQKYNFHMIKHCSVNAKLDIKTTRSIQKELNHNLDEENKLTIPQILEKVNKLDANIIFHILTKSIINKTKTNEHEIMRQFDFSMAFEYVIDILVDSMPFKSENGNEPLFEDELELEDDIDWDFDYMSYLWNVTMKRNDDYRELTPKEFFKQLELFEKMNGGKNEKVEEL